MFIHIHVYNKHYFNAIALLNSADVDNPYILHTNPLRHSACPKMLCISPSYDVCGVAILNFFCMFDAISQYNIAISLALTLLKFFL